MTLYQNTLHCETLSRHDNITRTGFRNLLEENHIGKGLKKHTHTLGRGGTVFVRWLSRDGRDCSFLKILPLLRPSYLIKHFPSRPRYLIKTVLSWSRYLHQIGPTKLLQGTTMHATCTKVHWIVPSLYNFFNYRNCTLLLSRSSIKKIYIIIILNFNIYSQGEKNTWDFRNTLHYFYMTAYKRLKT